MNLHYDIDLATIDKAFREVPKIKWPNTIMLDELLIEEISCEKGFKERENRKSVEYIWKNIKKAFYSIYLGGKDVKNKTSEIFSILEGTKKDSSKNFLWISLIIKQRIAHFKEKLYNRILTIFPSELSNGSDKFGTSKITLTHEFEVSGGIEVSITKLLDFAAKGKIIMEVEYSPNNDLTKVGVQETL